MSPEERDAWVDFVVEASGASEAFDKLEEHLKDNPELRDMSKQMKDMIFTRKNTTDLFGDVADVILNVWQNLSKSYDEKQVNIVLQKI